MLARMLFASIEAGRISPFMVPRGICFPPCILYADDIFFLCGASSANARCIMSILQDYGSGQLVNPAKSKVYYSVTLSAASSRRITNILGFIRGGIPFNYLGAPI